MTPLLYIPIALLLFFSNRGGSSSTPQVRTAAPQPKKRAAASAPQPPAQTTAPRPSRFRTQQPRVPPPTAPKTEQQGADQAAVNAAVKQAVKDEIARNGVPPGVPKDIAAKIAASPPQPTAAPIRTPKEAATALREFLLNTHRFGSKADRPADVMSAQRDLGVKADGIVGPITRAAAKKAGVTLPAR